MAGTAKATGRNCCPASWIGRALQESWFVPAHAGANGRWPLFRSCQNGMRDGVFSLEMQHIRFSLSWHRVAGWAIEDAQVIADCLEQHDGRHEVAFKAFMDKRMPRVTRVQETSRTDGKDLSSSMAGLVCAQLCPCGCGSLGNSWKAMTGFTAIAPVDRDDRAPVAARTGVPPAAMAISVRIAVPSGTSVCSIALRE